ncbi:imelysin family protein [Gymnodinialimonas ceratoperidinii]|uniref:Imelysin family protein n=1 Tax=Gymnodinialimonas ceratoperidinii TaxID=2856823 RepID=A0A8F6TVI7_9RHOB|nr:imelysin family protein [Gymnodinialimonas ceratoperidinii]QXT38959.1 imelysin family protein [Gymnodinialimonas ceratoperidinii]
MRLATLTLIAALPSAAVAQDHQAAIDAALDMHVLPGVTALAETSETLASVAAETCGGHDLTAAYNAAFDAWVHVSHLRFGPFEADNRAFALAFWPDSRGATPRALTQLIDDTDPVIDAEYASVSVAARGFYAMEFLLFDDDISTRCDLVRVMARDIATTTAAIRDDWTGTHAELMRTAGENDRYQSEAEAVRALFNALTTGLEFNADVRLGRPLGTFDRPRPNRAEARRSERSLRNLAVSMEGLAELSAALTSAMPDLHDDMIAAFDAVIAGLEQLDDPTLASVADPQGRLRIEALQQRISELRQLILTEIGPSLGVSAGFNSLDGD